MTVATSNPTANGTLLSAYSADALEHQRFMLQGLRWPQYVTISDALPEWPRLRLTYDRGNLELMAPSWNHEWWKRRFGLVIPILGVELDLDIQGGGSTTFRREDLERGLEPDECFYVEHAAAVRGRRRVR